MDIIHIEDIKDEKILFVNISKTYINCGQKSKKCITLGNWRININRAKKVEYVMGVHKGEIVSVVAIENAKQLVDSFEENNFPCCDFLDCHRCQEKLKLKDFNKNPKDYKNDADYQRLNGRVYFIEDKNVVVSMMEKEYVGKKLLTKNGKKFSNYVRYVNV